MGQGRTPNYRHMCLNAEGYLGTTGKFLFTTNTLVIQSYLVSPLVLTWEECGILRRVLYADNVLMLKIRAHRYPLPPTPLTPTHTVYRKMMNERSPVFTALLGCLNLGPWHLKLRWPKDSCIRQFILWGLRRITLLKCSITKTSHTWRKHAFP